MCANCEEPILGQPVYFDGNVYCCTGCIAGGPCICTYGPVAPAVATTVFTPISSPPSMPMPATAPTAPVPAYSMAAQPPSREPIPFPGGRDPGLRAIVLRLGGFRDQRDLLEFALALEDVGVLAEVSLTRAEPADAWFAVRATSTQQVVAALQEMRGWLITANASESYVEGRVESVSIEDELAETGPVLPQRPRFRVFSPRRGQTARPAAAVRPAPSEVAAVAPVLQPAVAVQPPARVPAYTLPTMPVLPVPARTAPVPQPARFVAPSRPVLPVAPAALAPAKPYVAEPAPAVEPVAAPAVKAPEPARAPAPVSAPAQPAPVARPAAMGEAPHQTEMIAADDRPGGAVPLVEHLTLVVYPFHSFVALNEFQVAVRALRGVTNTRVRRFYRGTLHLAVDYEDVIPLAERLQDLRGFRWQMVSESRQEIELLLEETGTLLAAEGDG